MSREDCNNLYVGGNKAYRIRYILEYKQYVIQRRYFKILWRNHKEGGKVCKFKTYQEALKHFRRYLQP